ncbi:MAG: TolB family protein [Chloroflexota bacterium]
MTRFNGPQWSPDGRSLLYLQGRDFGEFSLTRINRATGAQVPMLPDDRPVLEAAWSPDGTHLLYTAERRGRADIYVIAVADGEPHNLTENNFQDTRPSWSPDGTQIAFLSNREGGWHLYVTSINGEPAQRLTTVPLGISATWATLAWSPDGARIAYTHEGDLFTIETADGSVRRLTIDQPIPATLNWFTFRP